MNMKVIFKPYWTLATNGFSEMNLVYNSKSVTFASTHIHISGVRLGRVGYVREHSPAEGEGEGDDEEHEQCHLRHQEHEDL